MLALRQDYESHVNVLCNPISPQNLRNGCVLICNSFSSWCAVSTSSFVRDHIFFVKTLGSTQRLVVWITVTDASFMSWSSDPISVGININSVLAINPRSTASMITEKIIERCVVFHEHSKPIWMEPLTLVIIRPCEVNARVGRRLVWNHSM